jgi:hypothetical protein
MREVKEGHLMVTVSETLMCDEWRESYDDEQNEIDWQFVCQYEEYMMMLQDDQWEWDYDV